MIRVKQTALLVVAVLFPQLVQATVTISLPPPSVQAASASGGVLYLAGNTSGTISATAGGQPFLDPGYAYPEAPNILNTSPLTTNPVTDEGSQYIWLDISSNQAFSLTGTQILTITLSLGANQNIPIRAASITSGVSQPSMCVANVNCTNGGGAAPTGTADPRYLSAIYTNPGAPTRVGFNVADICASGVSETICAGNAPGTPVSQGITVIVDILASTTTGTPPTAPTATSDTTTFTLELTDGNPTLVGDNSASCPSTTLFYFPGDSSIKLHTANFQPSQGGGAAPLSSLVVLGNLGGIPAAGSAGFAAPTSIRDYLTPNNADQYVGGFSNTTNGSDNEYGVSVYSENAAGIVSDFPCSLNNVQAQPIMGVLTASRCFIATAAFHDGNAPPVKMLRHFRDQILSRFNIGRWFIKNYYHYSPPFAEWTWDKPFMRSVALHFLAPIELAAWSMLEISRGEDVSNSAPADTQTNAQTQPYIERLKKSNDLAPQPSEGYTEELKKKIPADNSAGESYTEQIKKQLQQDDSDKDYAAKVKEGLPPEKDSESTIKKIKEHRDKLKMPELPPPQNIVGVKIGISPGINVNGGGEAYSSVYGTAWAPDVMIHYEREVLHSETWGSLGLGGDLGITYSSGFGQLTYAFPPNSGNYTSETHFSMLQFPFIADAYFRFNLLKFLRPYIGGGAGALLYSEFRDDGQPGHMGYSFIFMASGGLSLMMDFMDPDIHKEAYLNDGIQHVFLNVEFLTLNSFASPVSVSRTGLYGGFLFEF